MELDGPIPVLLPPASAVTPAARRRATPVPTTAASLFDIDPASFFGPPEKGYGTCPDSVSFRASEHPLVTLVADGKLGLGRGRPGDRKSTRLNSSHRTISYAVF